MEEMCSHMEVANSLMKESSNVCEDCIGEGTKWVQLRLCLACGNIGCCDSSIGRHATKHFEESKHPVMTDFPARTWKWCYVDRQYG